MESKRTHCSQDESESCCSRKPSSFPPPGRLLSIEPLFVHSGSHACCSRKGLLTAPELSPGNGPSQTPYWSPDPREPRATGQAPGSRSQTQPCGLESPRLAGPFAAAAIPARPHREAGGHGAVVSVEGVPCSEWCPARGTRPAGTRGRRPASRSVREPCVGSLRWLAGRPRRPLPRGPPPSLLSSPPRAARTAGLAPMHSSPSVRHDGMPSSERPRLCRKGVTLRHLPGLAAPHAASGRRAASSPWPEAEAAPSSLLRDVPRQSRPQLGSWGCRFCRFSLS